MHVYTISNWAWSSDMQEKKKSERPAHSLADYRIDSLILPRSSKLFWGSSLPLLFDFERVLRSRLDWVWSQLTTIDWPRVANRLWLRYSDVSFGFVRHLRHIFMLATIGIVDCTFRRIGLHPSRFHFCVWGTAFLLLSWLAERNENITVFLTATVP